MNVGTFWDHVRTALGLEEPRIAEAVARATQLLIVAAISLWIAARVSERIKRAARSGRLPLDVASLVSRAAALFVLFIGVAIGLAILGIDETAVFAILGATTVVVSLAFQDVGRAFVNGVYILVERPYRIGDRVRIGANEGRVEDVGVRLTHLRGAGGDRIAVPNSLVFASVVENVSLGTVEHQTYTARGIGLPISQIEHAVVEALQGAPHLSHRPPVIEFVEARPDGTDVSVTVGFDHGHRVDDLVLDRLRSLFPEATVSPRPPAAAT